MATNFTKTIPNNRLESSYHAFPSGGFSRILGNNEKSPSSNLDYLISGGHNPQHLQSDIEFITLHSFLEIY